MNWRRRLDHSLRLKNDKVAASLPRDACTPCTISKALYVLAATPTSRRAGEEKTLRCVLSGTARRASALGFVALPRRRTERRWTPRTGCLAETEGALAADDAMGSINCLGRLYPLSVRTKVTLFPRKRVRD